MKAQIQKLKSSKLFYNKWPYKVECIQPGASKIIRYPNWMIKSWCNDGSSARFSEWDNRHIDKASLLAFFDAATPFLENENLQIRAEGSHFNIYCKDTILLEEINKGLNRWIKNIWGPTTNEEYEFLMSNGHKKILRDALPKGLYRYKVYFKNRWPKEKRQAFYSWSKKFTDKVEISCTSKLWINGEKMYVQDPFMYVADDKMLSMIGMFSSGYVKKVEEFILRENVLPT